MMHMLRNKSFLLFVFVCSLFLVGLVVVLNDYSAKNQAKRDELEEMYESLYEQAMLEIEQSEIKREQERKEHAQKEASYSPYQKLNDKEMLTNIFYLGDQNAYGKGLKDPNDSWKMLMREKYDSFEGQSTRIHGTQSIEKPDGGTLAYLNRLFDIYKSAYKPDLMFLCIGTQGAEESFGAEYEKLVRKAKVANSNSDVICIIEHNQTNSEVEAILRICDHYELLFVDMRPYFEGRESELAFEDGLPNEAGHALYADVIFETLKTAVEEKRETKDFKDTGVFLTSQEVEEFDAFANEIK